MCKRHLNKNVSRRDILKYSLAGAGIAALGPLGNGIRTATGAPLVGLKRVVSIYGYGGYDGLNLLVPTGNQAYYDRRMIDPNNYDPNTDIAIQPADALDLGGGYGLHPMFQRVKGLWDDGDVAVFRKVGYPSANLSHFISQDIHSWGVRGDFNDIGIDVSGWVARYADNYAQTSMGAAALGIGRPLEFEGGSTNPFLSSRLQNFDFSDSSISDGDHAHRLQAAQDILASYSGDTLSTEAKNALDQGYTLADQIQTALAAFDADPLVGNGYPNNSPGRYMRDAAVLIHGGFETEVFMTGIGGWDTHGNQGGPTGNQANLISRLDTAIGVFKDDCETMGVWDDVVIIVSSEFGRRNFMNGSTGTDHGHGNFFFAIGGAVGAANGGGLYGDDVTESDIADNNWLGYTLDYRDIFKEAVSNHLGGSAAVVFPEPQDINTVLNYV